MFRALLCPSSGAQKSLQSGHLSSLTAPNFQSTATQEPNCPCGNQHYSREFLMMGIEVTETCWAYHKYNKTRINIYFVLILQLSQRCTFQYTSNSKTVCSSHSFIIYIGILLVRVQIRDRATGKICSMDDTHDEFID